ncbi:hypothetical protein BCR33DRAFT_711235 [Rhizoclosmatium globosum]|uniref:Uncharacterized protein n=1 Tax=Rhizoclosmatium globosum TaxID=329046 RepID=A0A1Y2D3M7_9FUNG|nr:hypothetical protein BCR33DRAFT_711235 [Rhizoclosmatium globosum]|eukprot:ORY53891.1 hypothetical protein BCR33DRAFT_711235 [Rhizoclosmatium globosum]
MTPEAFLNEVQLLFPPRQAGEAYAGFKRSLADYLSRHNIMGLSARRMFLRALKAFQRGPSGCSTLSYKVHISLCSAKESPQLVNKEEALVD